MATALSLPPIAVLASAAAELAEQAPDANHQRDQQGSLSAAHRRRDYPHRWRLPHPLQHARRYCSPRLDCPRLHLRGRNQGPRLLARCADWIVEQAQTRALLSLDMTQLGQIADLGPRVQAAYDAWYSLPYRDMREAIKTLGFAAWMERWERGEIVIPEPKAPKVEPAAVEQPAPYEPDRTSIEWRAGSLTGVLYCRLTRNLDEDRAGCLIDILQRICDAPADERDRLVDALLLTTAEHLEAA